MADFTITEPKFKPHGKYLKPRDWVDPEPAEDWTPGAQGYGVAAECWWVGVNADTGARWAFAARTPETALSAAQAFVEQERARR